MTGIYGGSGGIYKGSTTTPKKKQGRSILGGILHDLAHNPVVAIQGHMAQDIKDMAFGLPTGLALMATHPERAIEAMAQSTWHDWSPLFHGDLKKFAMQFYDHPLAPILDVLSLATLGAGTATKIGSGLSKAGLAAEGGIAERLAMAGRPFERELRAPGGGGVVHSKTYAGNPLIRARQLGVEKALNGLADFLPSMFAVGKKIDAAYPALRGAERADATRWFMRDKLDLTMRVHAAQTATNNLVAAIVGQSKRMVEDTHTSMQEWVPYAVRNIEANAHKMTEADFIGPLRGAPTKAYIKRASSKERKAMRKEGLTTADAAWTQRLERIQNEPMDIVGKKALAHPQLNPDVTFFREGAEQNVRDFMQAYEDKHGWTPELLHDWLKGEGTFANKVDAQGNILKRGRNYGAMVTTHDWRQAARGADDSFLAVRNHHYATHTLEAANSVHFMSRLWRSTTGIWKWAILAARPAFLVNNAVGNLFMYMVSSGPQGFRGLVDAFRQVRRPEVIQADIARATRPLFRTSIDFQDRNYLGAHRGFSRDTQEYLGVDRMNIGSVKARFARRVAGGLYDLTHAISDTALRRARINVLLRQRPEVQALMREGHHFDDAAAAVSENRAIREAIMHQVNDTLGQYHYLNPAERATRAIVPFYTWDRAIARHGVHLFLDRPTTAAMMTQIGYQGIETTKELLGQIPEFLNSALPLSLLGIQPNEDGRLPILGTTGVNPYASLAAIVDTASALLTGGSDIGPALAQQLHPFITGGIESMTGQRLLTGARIPETEGGMIPQILANTLVGLPEAQIGTSGLQGAQGTSSTLFAKDLPQYLSAFLGVPVKYLNQQAAAKIAEQQNGTPVKRRRKKKRHGIY